MAISDAVKELIQKARIMNFEAWRPVHDATSIEYFQTADNERRYLTDAELAAIVTLTPKVATLQPIVVLLRDQATEIVDEARSLVLAEFPGITEPNGRLYPAERAEACWRDFWHFLRSITYGMAGGTREYTSQVGLHFMEALYQELHVPIEAMVLGLESLKEVSMTRLDDPQQVLAAPYFDHLIRKLRHFDDD